MKFIETPTCDISTASGMGKVLQKGKHVVYFECTMANKKPLEALDRSMQDIRLNLRPFWKDINIAYRRFPANIACTTSIDTSRQNKCMPEILFFVTTSKDAKINHKYASTAENGPSAEISFAGNLERKGVG